MPLTVRFAPKRKTFGQRKLSNARQRAARAVATAKQRMRRMRSRNVRTAGFLGIEKKFVDQTLADTTIPATIAGGELDPATNNCLNAVAQGDTESSRDGRKYQMKQIIVKGHIKREQDADQTQAPAAVNCWVALVLDTQTNGTQLNAEDVYTAVGHYEHPMRNLQYASRFKVLKYQEFQFDCPTMSWDGTNIETGGQVQNFTWVENMEIPVTCDGTGATVSDITDNSLHIIGAASNAGGANLLKLGYESRLRFVG